VNTYVLTVEVTVDSQMGEQETVEAFEEGGSIVLRTQRSTGIAIVTGWTVRKVES
jgi:hypothetical protein